MIDFDILLGRGGVTKTLSKLAKHISPGTVTLVGGLAIRYHMAKMGREVEQRSPFNDLDVLVERLDYVPTSVVEDFKIAHFHTDGRGGFYFALVDPETKIKVDIFDFSFPPAGKTETVRVGKYGFQVVSLEGQLVKALLDLFAGAACGTADKKQLESANLLSQLVDREMAQRVWEKRSRGNGFPKRLEDALANLNTLYKKDPASFERVKFRELRCTECATDAKYPLTPLSEIYKILGVEPKGTS